MMSASRNGVVVFSPVIAQQRLVWFDTGGRRLGQVGAPVTFDGYHRISPDGQTVATAIHDPRTELSDIVIYGLQNENSYRLTVDARWEGEPIWSPDGSTIFFSNDHHGSPDVYSIEVGGDGTFREVFRELGAWFPSDVTPDGRFLSIWKMGHKNENDSDLWIVPLDGEGKPFAFNPTRGDQVRSQFSPDGNRIAYVSDESGNNEIFLDTFPDPSGGKQISIHGGSSPVWSPDGRKLYFSRFPSDDRDWAVMVVEFSDTDPSVPLPPEVLFNPGPFKGFDLAPDGERFLLKLMPDGPPDNHVILNWDEVLEAAAPEDLH